MLSGDGSVPSSSSKGEGARSDVCSTSKTSSVVVFGRLSVNGVPDISTSSKQPPMLMRSPWCNTAV